MGVVTPSDQSTDANDGMINVLGKLVSHCLADFIIRFAVMPIGSRKTSQVRDRFYILNDDVGWRFGYSEFGSQTRRERKKLRPFNFTSGLDEQITRDPCRSSISAGRNRETDTSKAARATRMLPARANTS
jgi:hypothetical protein